MSQTRYRILIIDDNPAIHADNGCELAQGYRFCRPLPAQRCRELLAELAARTSFTETLRLRGSEFQPGPAAQGFAIGARTAP